MGVVQADMSAEEAIKFITSFLNGEGNQANQTGKVILALALARKALEEKVELEKVEKKRWRPDLKTLAEFVRVPEPEGFYARPLTSKEIMYNHAADIIQAIDEHVMPELKRYIGCGPTGPLTIALRKALGDYL